MTPERLGYLIEQCFRRRRMNGETPHLHEVAKFFDVSPATLRRWLNGSTPIPRPIEVVFETFHAFPDDVNSKAVDNANGGVDDGSKA